MEIEEIQEEVVVFLIYSLFLGFDMYLHRKKILFFSVLSFLFFPSTVFAYLDPGTGSMLLQLALGGIAGLLVLVKLFWSKITNLFRK